MGVRIVDSTERIEDFDSEGNVVSSWQTSPLEEWVVGMIVCHADQFRVGKIKIVDGNQRHGKIPGWGDQFVFEYCSEEGFAAALRTLHSNYERFIHSDDTTLEMP